MTPPRPVGRPNMGLGPAFSIHLTAAQLARFQRLKARYYADLSSAQLVRMIIEAWMQRLEISK